MNEQVKSLLERHNYILKVTRNPESGLISLHLPDRIQEPPVSAYTHDYLISDNKVYATIDGETSEVPCPTYACRTLVLVDIRTICKFVHFDPSLLEFYNGEDKITEAEFYEFMLPKSVTYTEDMRKQEYNLKELVSRAINSILPFAPSFTFEAEQMGVGLGYSLIAAYALGGNDE